MTILSKKQIIAEESAIPWRHVVVDNFLWQEDLDYLINWIEKNYTCDYNLGETLHVTRVARDGAIDKNSFLDEKFLEQFVNRYNPILLQFLEQLAPKKATLYTHMQIGLTMIRNAYHRPIHYDLPDKLLSCVVYMNPGDHLGTFLYTTKNPDSIKKVVPWQPNRALIFARKEKETWHSVTGMPGLDRMALIINLIGEDISRVHKIENKSNLQAKLEYWKIRNIRRLLKFLKISANELL